MLQRAAEFDPATVGLARQSTHDRPELDPRKNEGKKSVRSLSLIGIAEPGAGLGIEATHGFADGLERGPRVGASGRADVEVAAAGLVCVVGPPAEAPGLGAAIASPRDGELDGEHDVKAAGVQGFATLADIDVPQQPLKACGRRCSARRIRLGEQWRRRGTTRLDGGKVCLALLGRRHAAWDAHCTGNWTGLALVCPRTELARPANRAEVHRTGVDILVGPSHESNLSPRNQGP